MKEIINILNENGYDAYVVGGFVRDYILGIESKDIDISTNAPIEEIKRIFKGRGRSFDKYFSYHIEEDGFSYDITTFRKELKYNKNKPVELEMTNDFKEDLLRRDFTINTFAIDNNGMFVDLLGFRKDLDNKIIRVVGDTYQKLSEDKTRIIRAIRFACTLDFSLDEEIIKFIKKNAKMLNDIPREYIKSELDKIFNSNKVGNFFEIVKKYNLSKYLNIKFDSVKNTYNKYGVWAQIEANLPFSRAELSIINNIKAIINNGNITFDDMSMYPDVVIYNAVNILNQETKYKAYNDVMSLHSIIDIDIDLDTIASYFELKDIKKVYKIIERNIMEGNLINNSYYIELFLKDLKI